MRIVAMVAMMMLLGAGFASAVTIHLNDGGSVQGDVIKQDAKSIQLNVDGVTMTYYADEIKDVDGNPFAAQPTPPAEPAAGATQPSDQLGNSTAPISTSEGIDPQKRELILKFIDVFGTRQALNNNFAMMIQQIEKQKPDEAQKIRDRVKIDEIIDRLVPIYDRNFTTEDLEAFIAFYGSPEGQKLIGTIPEIMKESVQESIKYMQEKFPEVNKG